MTFKLFRLFVKHFFPEFEDTNFSEEKGLNFKYEDDKVLITYIQREEYRRGGFSWEIEKGDRLGAGNTLKEAIVDLNYW